MQESKDTVIENNAKGGTSRYLRHIPPPGFGWLYMLTLARYAPQSSHLDKCKRRREYPASGMKVIHRNAYSCPPEAADHTPNKLSRVAYTESVTALS